MLDMMIIRRKRHIEDPASSGSLNDLSFLLIIFFIVIAGFNVNKGFLMHLPETDKPRIVEKKDLFRCSLDASGSILLDGRMVQQQELEVFVSEKLAGSPNLTFVLTIDPAAPYQNVIDVIAVIRKLNVDNFSFRMGDR
jgi:biopolymer transport protein ExbD